MAIKNPEIEALSDALATKNAAKPKPEDVAEHADNVRDCVEALVTNFVEWNGFGFTVRKGQLLREGKPAEDELGNGELVEWLKKAFNAEELQKLDGELRTHLEAAAR